MTRKLPPHDSNGFWQMNGQPWPGCAYAAWSPPEEDQVQTAMMYLALFKPVKRGGVSSYGLKHRAENWGGRNGRSSYVANGALIEAAIRLGLTVKPYRINALIGVSRSEVRKELLASERSK